MFEKGKRAWFFGITGMESVEEFFGVLDIGREVPAVVFGTVANPTDLVLETVVGFESRVDAAVENFFDFEFEITVHFNGRWRVIDTIGNGVRSVGFEEGDMEDGMNGFQARREFEASGVGGDLLKNAIWTKTLVIKFLHGSLGLDIARVKPAKVAGVKVGDFLAAVLSRGLVTID